MKKIIITENQLDMIKRQLNEGVSDRYSREVEVDVYVGNSTYKGKEINDVSKYNMKLSYSIDIEAREWGIKDISLYAIEGDSELEAQIEYFVDENNTDFENVMIPIDWEKLEVDTNTGEGVITIGNTLEISLTNDENGNLIISHMSLPVYTI